MNITNNVQSVLSMSFKSNLKRNVFLALKLSKDASLSTICRRVRTKTIVLKIEMKLLCMLTENMTNQEALLGCCTVKIFD